MSKDELKEKMDRLAKLEEKEKKQKERTRKYGERSRAWTTLMIEKAESKGISVSKKEVDDYLNKKKNNK